MKQSIYILIAMYLLAGTSVTARSLPDSLPLTDTIGIHSQRVFLATDYYYSYHAATRLTGLQLTPLLRQPADSAASRLLSRARRRSRLPFPLFVGSYGLMLGAVRANPLQHPELSGTLLLGSVAALTTGFVAGFSASATMHRAVQRHNLLITANDAAYVKPRPTLGEPALTATDTLSVKPQLLATRYTYRGIQLAPELQLRSAMQSFNDPFITEGLRQNRIVRGVAGLIGAVSGGFLSYYYLTRFSTQAAGRRVGPANLLVYYAFTGVAVSFTLHRVADKTTRQVAARYNRHLVMNNE
ncbi:hypothetical protein [Fibrella forsythiae]|uniref:Uncharacterized protein n=1 Tax=Fibrella forsythiae TaxID=2817061 RepID=A0ABS3JQP0_9BACT|nr:hypothetical protein [Fibrella forsythiae]MBO0951691.1 hypothetical protein [Fibrella forsythiae]